MFQFLPAHMPLRSLRWLESKAICFCQSPSLRKNVNHLLRNLPYLGGGGGWGGLGLGLTIFFFCQSPSKNLFEESDIVDLSEEKCEPPIKKSSIPWWWWWGGGGGEGLGMRVESEMSWLEKISEVVAGAAMLDKGPDWSQGVLGNRKSLLRVMK